jgi:hypothetical protein
MGENGEREGGGETDGREPGHGRGVAAVRETRAHVPRARRRLGDKGEGHGWAPPIGEIGGGGIGRAAVGPSGPKRAVRVRVFFISFLFCLKI